MILGSGALRAAFVERKGYTELGGMEDGRHSGLWELGGDHLRCQETHSMVQRGRVARV